MGLSAGALERDHRDVVLLLGVRSDEGLEIAEHAVDQLLAALPARHRLLQAREPEHAALRVVGLDRAGNQTTRDVIVRVDRTIRSVTWARSSFTPRAGQKDRLTFVLRRKATVTVAIYQGSTLVRRIWTGRALPPGTYGWTWNGKTAAGAFVAPGSYKVVVNAASGIGPSRFAKSVTVRAP